MLIGCDSNASYDRYLIEGVDDLDQLHKYLQDNMPVKCYELGRRYKNSVYLIEELSEQLVYLSNYKSVYRINGMLMKESELVALEEQTCATCKWNDGSLRADLKCKYIPTENGGCNKHSEKLTSIVLGWIKKVK